MPQDVSFSMQDELYSSRVKDFEVFGRQSHPRAEGSDYGAHLNASAWQLLGRFTAANTKGTQVRGSQLCCKGLHLPLQACLCRDLRAQDLQLHASEKAPTGIKPSLKGICHHQPGRTLLA